jgi:iron-sulfur cluster repair protein YtfE (RIC family)
MKNITDELAKTHQVVCKVLEGFNPSNPRFQSIMETLHRTVLAHAWLQDEVLFPALENKLLIQIPLLNEIFQEHKDLDRLLKALLDTSLDCKNELEAKVLQIRVILETHFMKETEALYPLVEKVLDLDTSDKLAEEMERRQMEVREVVSASH